MENNIGKKYMGVLKHNLVYIGNSEKNFLKVLNHEIIQFIDEQTTYEDLVTHFGEPKMLASCYLEEYDEDILRKKIRYKKMFLGISTIILIAVIMIIVLVGINYINGENSYVTREQEIISGN